MAHYRRRKPRSKPRCNMCTPHRGYGNSIKRWYGKKVEHRLTKKVLVKGVEVEYREAELDFWELGIDRDNSHFLFPHDTQSCVES